MQVYLLWHVHELDADQDDVKLIGAYSSEENGNRAADRAKLLPGFRDLPEGLLLEAYTLDEDHWREGYVTIYPEDM